jgi:hypothetical protein
VAVGAAAVGPAVGAEVGAAVGVAAVELHATSPIDKAAAARTDSGRRVVLNIYPFSWFADG